MRHYYAHLKMDQKTGKRDYSMEPFRFFSLYMHLEPFADMSNEAESHPPWFNIWRRKNPSTAVGMNGDKGQIFFPDIELSIGDWVGNAGKWGKNKHCVHFEIFSPQDLKSYLEIAEATSDPNWPFNSDAVDKKSDWDQICEHSFVNKTVKDLIGDGVDNIDLRYAAPEMRGVRSFHISEWAIHAESALEEAYTKGYKDKEKQKKRLHEEWPHIERFLWWSDVIGDDDQLSEQLGEGQVWFYHPVTFMTLINQIVTADYGTNPTCLGIDSPQSGESSEPTSALQLTVKFESITIFENDVTVSIPDDKVEFVFMANGELVCKKSFNYRAGLNNPFFDSECKKEITQKENEKLTIEVKSNNIPELGCVCESYSESSTPPFGIAGEPIAIRNDMFQVRVTVEER